MSIIEQNGSATDAFGSVGAQLAGARDRRGWSIDDLCARTKIRPAVIRALEDGDIGPSGGAVYARGHIRSLAHSLGLDTAPLLAAFDATHAVDAPPVLMSDPDAVEVSLRPSGPRVAGPRWPLGLALILVVVIAVALVQLILPGSKDSAKPSASLVPSAPKHSAASTKPKAPAVPSLSFPVPAQGVTLRIVLTTSPSWLDVSDGRGVSLIQRVVTPSSKPLDLHADGVLHATIGAAGVASLSCNGHPLGKLGGPTEVVSLTLTRGSALCPAA